MGNQYDNTTEASAADADKLVAPHKYGNRNVPKMYAQINTLRGLIRSEGTPDIQAAWDAVEEHIDFAYSARGAK